MGLSDGGGGGVNSGGGDGDGPLRRSVWLSAGGPWQRQRGSWCRGPGAGVPVPGSRCRCRSRPCGFRLPASSRQRAPRVTHTQKSSSGSSRGCSFEEGFLLINSSLRDSATQPRHAAPPPLPSPPGRGDVPAARRIFQNRVSPLASGPFPLRRHPVSSLSSADELIAFFLCILWRCPTA